SYKRLAFGDQAASSVEGFYRRKDGTSFPVEAVRRVVASAAAGIIGGVARDISTRKLAEDRARSQRLQQRVIAEFAQQALGNADLGEVLGNAAEIVARTLGLAHCRILQLGADGESLVVRAACGWPAEAIGGKCALPDPAGQTGRVLAQR